MHAHSVLPSPKEFWRLKPRGLGKRGLSGKRVLVNFVHHTSDPKFCYAVVTVVDPWKRRPSSRFPVPDHGNAGVTVELRRFKEKCS
jgi:hypothetical protein